MKFSATSWPGLFSSCTSLNLLPGARGFHSPSAVPTNSDGFPTAVNGVSGNRMVIMRVRLQSHMHISLHRLLPAFPLSIVGAHGRLVIVRRGYERLLLPGQKITNDPFDAMDLYLDGSNVQPAACTLEIDAMAPAALPAALHHRICKRVFLQPHVAWSAAFIAERLDISTAQLRRILFSQGMALTDLCRTQRLMRVLFEATGGQCSHARPGALCRLARK